MNPTCPFYVTFYVTFRGWNLFPFRCRAAITISRFVAFTVAPQTVTQRS